MTPPARSRRSVRRAFPRGMLNHYIRIAGSRASFTCGLLCWWLAAAHGAALQGQPVGVVDQALFRGARYSEVADQPWGPQERTGRDNRGLIDASVTEAGPREGGEYASQDPEVTRLGGGN